MTSASPAQPAKSASSPTFQLRGGTYTLLVLRLDDPKDPVLFQALRDKVAQSPNFFRNAPLVIDLQNLSNAPPFNMAELGRRLRQHQLLPIGVQNGTEEQNAAAINAGFSVLPSGRDAPVSVAGPARSGTAAAEPHVAAPVSGAPPAAAKTEPAPVGQADMVVVPSGPSRTIIQPVRSGKQVYAQGGDLVVLASISAGAELLSDGNIHVYGALRGRALAGVTGDRNARIFCRSLEAELVSIAGFWQVREHLPDTLIGKPAQILLDGERIAVEPLA